MALANYSDLKTEIAAQIARSDLSADDVQMDNFIVQAEADINRRLRTIRQTKEATITTAANTDDYTLPADFISIRTLEFDTDPRGIDYVPDVSAQRIATGVSRPCQYSLVFDADNDRWQIRFLPTPSGVYTLTLKYYAKIPALTADNTTNWLLTYHPQIYLDGCLYHAYKRFRNKELRDEYKVYFGEDISLLNAENQDTMFGGAGRRITYNGSIV